MQRKIRILAMESFDLVRMGLHSFFDNHPAVSLTATSDCMQDLPILMKQHQPDVILIDLQLIEDHGVENFSGLHRQSPESKILILSSNEERQLPSQMLPPSVAGIISKYSSCKLLMSAVTTIYAGKNWLSYSILPLEKAKSSLTKLAALSGNYSTADYFKLSKAESRVAYLACKGFSAKEIGRQLSITEKSVRNQLSAIYKKVGVRKQVQLCIKAPLHNHFQ